MSESTASAEWAKVRDLFLEIVDLEPGERAARMQELERSDPAAHGQVARLIAVDAGPAVDAEPATLEDERFGPYRPLRRIATGGMGEVYLARRDDGAFELDVAVKLLRIDASSEMFAQRFARERQTLAKLDHEGIARLIDGGTTGGGRPYLVMEFVDGVPLDQFVEAQSPGIQARVELFRRILDPVAYAHRNDVVHRDLKPGNILVRPDGMPKLVDFGIARPTDDSVDDGTPALTRTGQRLFTPAYASPEQVAEEDITTATDVFALGVILYELLTGRTPFGGSGSLREVERRILDAHPVPPSRCCAGTTRRMLSGDLDTITLKCLAKQPGARYADATALADDLDRHLSGRPILARKTSFLSHAWQFGRRRPAVAVAGFATAIAIVAALMALRAKSDRSAERERFHRIVATRLKEASALTSAGEGDKAEALLDKLPSPASPELTESLAARLRTERANIAVYRKDFDAALKLVSEAESSLAACEDPDPRDRVRLALLHSRTLHGLGRLDDAWEAAQAAQTLAETHMPPGSSLRRSAAMDVAKHLIERGDSEGAVSSMSAVIAELRALDKPHDIELGAALNTQANQLTKLRRYEEASQCLDEATTIARWHYGDGHIAVATLRSNRAGTLVGFGRYREAIEEYSAVIPVFEALERSKDVAIVLRKRGEAARKAQDWDRAIEDLRTSSERLRAEFGDEHALWRIVAVTLGYTLKEAGKPEDARRALELAVASPDVLPANIEIEARLTLGELLRDAGRDDDAVEVIDAALALIDRADFLSPEFIAHARQRAGRAGDDE